MKALYEICRKDPRFDLEAYLFLREALEYTVTHLLRPRKGPRRHISGRELAMGFRDYALEQFGPLAFDVLATWGIHQTEDIGSIVFNLVEAGELGKTEEDRQADFDAIYDFADAFRTPYLPPHPTSRNQEEPSMEGDI